MKSDSKLDFLIGDHAYKQNKEMTATEQMITSLPDVKTLRINPDVDEFMVLACDGIWNYLSSQEVVDFVRKRIQEGKLKVSQICEEVNVNILFIYVYYSFPLIGH